MKKILITDFLNSNNISPELRKSLQTIISSIKGGNVAEISELNDGIRCVVYSAPYCVKKETLYGIEVESKFKRKRLTIDVGNNGKIRSTAIDEVDPEKQFDEKKIEKSKTSKFR